MADETPSQVTRRMLREHMGEVRGRERAQLIRDQDHATFNKQKHAFDVNQYNLGTPIVPAKMGRTHRPIRYYVVLGDPALSIYINGAKERARAAYELKQHFWFQDYYVGPAFVGIKMHGRLCLIRILPADNFEFEFATSANPIVKFTSVQGSLSFESYKGVHVGVHVGIVEGKMVTDAVIRTQKRTALVGEDTSIIKRYYQVELIHEPVSYTTPQNAIDRQRYPYDLFESFAPGNPHTGIYGRTTQSGNLNAAWTANRTPLFRHLLRDQGFDVPFQDNVNLEPVRTAFIRGTADWPRAMGKQVVKDEKYGEREFAIYVDAFNQFMVFPTSEIDAENGYNQNVLEFYVQRLTPTMPSWCYKQTTKAIDIPVADLQSKWLLDQPEPDWKFNPAGTRACSIFYERVAWARDDALFNSSDGTTASDPFTTTDFNNLRDQLGVQARHGVTFNNSYNTTRYFVGAGIVEVAITISLTGFDPNQYVANATVREVRRPTTSQYSPIACGYAWYDAPFNAVVKRDKQGKIISDERIVKAGDFIAWDAEWYYNLVDNAAGTMTQGAFSIKRFDTNPDTGAITEVEVMTPLFSPLIALDLANFSWVQYAYDEDRSTQRICPKKTGDTHVGPYNVDWTYPTIGAAVIIGGRLKEILYPEKAKSEVKARVNKNFTEFYRKNDPLLNRRAIKTVMDEKPNWKFMPLNDSTDWSTGNYNQWRLYQLTNFGALAGPHAPPADATTISRFVLGATYAYLPPTHCYYSASFKFAWYTYVDISCTYFNVCANSTFYVHPSGTWAFFDNTYVFLGDGMPYVGDHANTLDAYEPKDTIEHVIFDRVHFEIKTDHLQLGTHNTTFMELYNRAVKAGKLAKTLEANINEMVLSDLRGTFKKEIVFPYSTPPYTDISWLDLRLSWDGVSYWYPESGIQGGGYHLFASPTAEQGGLVGLTMDHPWFTAPAYGGFAVYPALDTQHIRFANALVLQSKL